MTRVGLISDTSGVESDNPVENPDFIIAFASLTHTASYLQLKSLRQLGFVIVEVSIKAHSNEIVAMHDERNVATGVMKATRARGARHESPVLECSSINVFPDYTGVASAVNAPD